MDPRDAADAPSLPTRRAFLGAAAAAGAASLVPGLGPRAARAGSTGSRPTAGDPFAPRIEVLPDALRHNVTEVRRLTGDRPILAVVKNNAYGLGLELVASVLEPLDSVEGFAVVTPAAAMALLDSGVRKPVLLMGMADDDEAAELARRGVRLSVWTDDAAERVRRAGATADRPVAAHLYLDTGLGRMGVPAHRALPWLQELAGAPGLRVEGTFMAFTEDADFDAEQLGHFLTFADTARSGGLPIGRLHAASSNAVFHLPDAHLDLVRPGIALFGSYPSRPEEERKLATLRPAVRLTARVVRVERLRPGDGVSYGRNWVAERPTWTATLPVGHADGYPRRAVEGARVLIGERTYPVIGAVSASHAIVELGDEKTAEVGDPATLIGPERPEITPDGIAAATGVSVYDVLMHLGAHLPRSLG